MKTVRFVFNLIPYAAGLFGAFHKDALIVAIAAMWIAVRADPFLEKGKP